MKKEKNKAPYLTVKMIIIIIVFVLPMGVILGVALQKSIHDIEENIQVSLQNVVDVYMDALDNDMKRTDYYLYSSYIVNTDFVTLLNTKDEIKYENAKYKCIRDMRDQIYLSLNCDVLFYYSAKRDEYIMSCGEGAEKEKFCNFLNENPESKDKWTIVNVESKNYLFHIIEKGNVKYGAFINLDEFVENVEEALNYESATVSILNVGEEENDDGLILAQKESAHADIVLGASVTTQETFKILSNWEWGIVFMLLLVLGMIPLLYMIMKRWILSPLKELNYAHHELEIGNEKYRITEKGNSMEFSEAYYSFNKMADNIYDLKVENMEKELVAKELELSNLQLQIRPHFLLNTFNLIYNLASEKDVDNIKEVILYLSGYFRYIFRDEKKVELFQKELVLIEGYMKAAKLRYPEQIDIRYQIDPEIFQVRIPPLLIHNFVENVVKHALVKERMIYITLEAEYADGEVTFIVSDNGVGMSEEQVRIINEEYFMKDEKNSSVGLRNSAMRLKCFYGETAKIRVQSEKNYGTVFTITFPYDLEET